jgi:hypothetical protein
MEKYQPDVESIDSIIRAYYEVVSEPAGQPRNLERDLFMADSDQ